MVELQPTPVASPPRTGPALSVCIANWNCRELLRNCLRSLFDQPQGVPFEVIVADNGSTDGAAEMLLRDFPQVRLIRNAANRGFSAASNQAASVARGPLLFFLNNDTALPPRTLARFVRFFAENPHVGMAGPRLRGADGIDQISYRKRPSLPALLHRVSVLRGLGLFRKAYYDYRRRDFSPRGRQRVDVLMGAAVVLPREVFHSCGGWDEQFRFGVEDIDLSTKVAQTRPIVFLGEIAITHHGREASRGNIGFTAPNVAIGYVKYLRKNGVKPVWLMVYKTLVSLDAPLQIAGKLLQATLRAFRGRRVKAQRSLLAARGVWHFLRRDLGRFWAA